MAVEFLGKVKLGCLKTDGKIQTPRTIDFKEIEYNWDKWSIVNSTEANEEQNLEWFKFIKDDYTVLVCDRVLICNTNYTILKSDNLENGKNITIDGLEFKEVLTTIEDFENYKNAFEKDSKGYSLKDFNGATN